MFGVWAFLPRFLQTPDATGYGLGETISASGLVMLPMLVALGVAGFLTGPLSRRVDLRVQLHGGGDPDRAVDGLVRVFHTSAWMPAIAGAAFGFGLGISNSAMASLVVQSVPAPRPASPRDELEPAHHRQRDRHLGDGRDRDLEPRAGGFPTEAAYDTAFLTMAGLALVAALIAGLVPVILRRRGYVEPIVITTPVATSMAVADAEAERSPRTAGVRSVGADRPQEHPCEAVGVDIERDVHRRPARRRAVHQVLAAARAPVDDRLAAGVARQLDPHRQVLDGAARPGR